MDMLMLLVIFLSLRVVVVPFELETSQKDFFLDVLAEPEALDSICYRSGVMRKVLVNVDEFGAVGDGVSDDTQAFVDAWGVACSASNSVLLVPEGGRYLVRSTRFQGPCAGKLTIQIDGTIEAPDDPKTWDAQNPRIWLGFYNLSEAILQGQGVLDGSGSKWWAASCKRNKSNPCVGAPTALTIDSCSAVKVKDVTIQNGQQMNFVISRSDSVVVSGVQVVAPGDSPNTDGIHITASTNVVLLNCRIGTGDDCISIVSGSSDIKMKNIFCGPGHGISIGSLGKDKSTGIVEKVVLDTASIWNTTNGLRIKTWQGGNGQVTNVLYQNVKMDDVSNPIIIDQFYCDSPKSCENQTSAVEISKIMYRDISGSSMTKHAVILSCSDTVPCTGIVLEDIKLEGTDGPVETYCNSAFGYERGHVQPSADCLLSSYDKDMIMLQKEDDGHIVHTEL